MTGKSIKISAIICTYNRNTYLREAIKSLVNQNLPKEFYEVIIVDNASNSNVKELVDEFSEVWNLTYIYEPTTGLSQARNRGWKAARGEYVAYLDDDAIASKDWLKNILDVFEKTEIKLGCVGGKIEPIWELPRPSWLYKELEVLLTILDYSDNPKILDMNQNLFGTNIAFLKQILKDAGGFNTAFGRKGKSLISGEEALLQEIIRSSGYKVLYDPNIFVQHHILKSRLNKKWFIKRSYCEGVSNALIEIYKTNPSKPAKIWRAIKEILSFRTPLREMMNLLISHKNPKWFFYKCILTIKIGYISRILNLKY